MISVVRYPLLIVLSGPSGVGKDAVLRQLRAVMPEIHYTLTATTRAPRSGEVDGVSYSFLSRQEFDGLLSADQLLAPAEVHGHWYGAPIEPMQRALMTGQDVLLKIDVKGATDLRGHMTEGVFIFLAPPSMADLVTRLELRHTELTSDLERRMRDAEYEMKQIDMYDYVVVNEDGYLDGTVRMIAAIITAQRLRTHQRPVTLSKH